MTKSPIRRIFESGYDNFTILTYIISAASIILLFTVAIRYNIELIYVFLFVIALPLLWIIIYYPKIWIYLAVAGFVLFMQQDEDASLSVADIVVAIYYNVFLIIWFLNRIFIKSANKNIYKTTEKPHLILSANNIDKFVLLFYSLALLNLIVSIANGVDLLGWLREYMLFSLILYYFPIREYFNDKKEIAILLTLIAFAAIFLDVKQFYGYYKLLINIKYAYQIGSTIRVNQQIYTAAAISAMTFFFYSKTIKGKCLAFVVSLLSTIAVISTFSRAFWIALVAIVGILFLFLKFRQIFNFFLIVILSAGLIFTSISIILPNQAKFITKFIGKRFSSAGEGKKDISVKSRFYEYEEVIRLIELSPIAGNGLRKEFSFYNSLNEGASKTTAFIHNGYLNIAYKLGIPLAVILYLALITFTFQGFMTAWKLKKYNHNVLYQKQNKQTKKNNDDNDNVGFYTALAISGTLSLIMLLVTNFITSSFLFRDGLMVTAFSIAFVEIASRKLKSIKLNNFSNNI